MWALMGWPLIPVSAYLPDVVVNCAPFHLHTVLSYIVHESFSIPDLIKKYISFQFKGVWLEVPLGHLLHSGRIEKASLVLGRPQEQRTMDKTSPSLSWKSDGCLFFPLFFQDSAHGRNFIVLLDCAGE